MKVYILIANCTLDDIVFRVLPNEKQARKLASAVWEQCRTGIPEIIGDVLDYMVRDVSSVICISMQVVDLDTGDTLSYEVISERHSDKR